MFNAKTIRLSEKIFVIATIFLISTLFNNVMYAQNFGSLKKGVQINVPQKTYKAILDPLPAGTYTVGTSGHFATIQEAFNKLSIDGIAGEVTLELIDELYVAPTDSFGFLLNGPIPGTNANSRVTIKPAANKNVTIQGNGFITVSFFNTNYITIDGVGTSGSTTLTIHTLPNYNYAFNDGIDFCNNSDNNIIQNITFINEDYTRSSGSGFWALPGSLVAPDNNLFQNNFVKQSGIGLFVSGYLAQVRASGNIIRGNLIGSENDSLIAWGIQIEKCENTIVENNTVQNLRPTNIYEKVNPGINSYSGLGDIIRNNIVHNIKPSIGYSSVGILLSGGSGSNCTIYNNMVYDISSTSAQTDSRVAGIQIWLQNSPKIYYNTVYLDGNGANHQGSAAFFIYGGWGGSTNVDVKNNIFVNSRDESPYCASAIYGNNYSLTSDYNDLFYEQNPNNCLVRIGSTKYNTITAWQVLGKDFHSISIMPCFCSPDLHIDCTMATCLEKRGTPIIGLDKDFDGELRNANLPDIGADEFNGLIPTGALTLGAYSVGSTGFFPSIESVFNRLSTDGVAGAVTLELTDNLYTAPATQYGFSLIGPILGAGPDSRVTIKPSSNKNVIIEGSNEAIFNFNNTSYLTIDGVGDTGATTLTIHALQNLSFAFNDALDFLNNSDHNAIQNVTFIVDDYLKPSAGIYFTGSAPDSNLIQYNFVKKAGMFISIMSGGKGNIIKENQIGSENDSLVAYGIEVADCEGTLIENNLIQNMKVTLSGSNQAMIGIALDAGNNQIIRNNVIKNIRSTSGYITAGIYVGVGGTNNQVYNNMVYDINSTSIQTNNRLAGVYLAYQTNPKIYYNSVYLLGSGATPLGSAALYIYASCTNVDAKNNIFVNTRDESLYCASAIYDYTTSKLTTDYNDLFYQSNLNSALVRIGNTKYNTLIDWRVTGQDLNSITEMPNFMSSNDLHINSAIPTNIESHGTPIAGITLDFDEQTRNSTTPDIGSDEFSGMILGVEEEQQLPTEFALLQNYPNPFNPSTKIKYTIPSVETHRDASLQTTLKVFDVLGNELATLVDEYKPAGSYEVEFKSTVGNHQLASGIYYYQLRSGDFVQTRKMILIK